MKKLILASFLAVSLGFMGSFSTVQAQAPTQESVRQELIKTLIALIQQLQAQIQQILAQQAAQKPTVVNNYYVAPVAPATQSASVILTAPIISQAVEALVATTLDISISPTSGSTANLDVGAGGGCVPVQINSLVKDQSGKTMSTQVYMGNTPITSSYTYYPESFNTTEVLSFTAGNLSATKNLRVGGTFLEFRGEWRFAKQSDTKWVELTTGISYNPQTSTCKH